MARRSNKLVDISKQMQIEWGKIASPKSRNASSGRNALPTESARPNSVTMVQRLPWDFRKSFPLPTDAAIEAGRTGRIRS